MFLLQKTPGTDYRVTRFALHEPTGGSRPDSDSEVIPFLHFTCKKGCGVDSRLFSDPLLLLAVQTGPSHRLHASSSSFFPFPPFSCTGSGGGITGSLIWLVRVSQELAISLHQPLLAATPWWHSQRGTSICARWSAAFPKRRKGASEITYVILEKAS